MSYVNRLQRFDSGERQALDQMFRDIWFGDVRNHDHSSVHEGGLIAASSVDHGGLAGLTDDDHTQYLLINGTRAMIGDLIIPATNKLRLDGNASGDTYIYEAISNRVDVVAGGSSTVQISAGSTNFVGNVIVNAGASDLSSNVLLVKGGGTSGGFGLEVQANNGDSLFKVNALTYDTYIRAGSRFFLDGGGDTYVYESSANRIDFFAGGGLSFGIFTDGAGIQSLDKLFLDGGSDTYITETSANKIDFFVGGASRLQVVETATPAVLVLGADLVVTAAKKLYLDSGIDTYLIESSSNVMDFFTGGTLALKLTSGQDVYTEAFTDYSSTSTVTGWSSFTTKKIYYKRIGKRITIIYHIVGTSNATAAQFTVPYANGSAIYVRSAGYSVDNGTAQTTASLIDLPDSSSTVSLSKDMSGTQFTNSGTKTIMGQFNYETA